MIEVRETRFDVAVLAAPRTPHWPSVGVRAISRVCTDAGLRVGIFGGSTMRVKGVLPLPHTGGVAIVQDGQARVHRIEARAIVRVEPWMKLPDPFPGWASEGCLPLDVAESLFMASAMTWAPAVAVLGSGNKALRFGSRLLESGRTGEVWCIEPRPDWGGKRFAGWEVERRRFEKLGGRVLEGTPVSLTRKSALLWEFRVEDLYGIRILHVTRVVSAGPFEDSSGAGEHPVGSFLYSLEQSSGREEKDDVEGWRLEEERGRWVGARISRSLAENLGRSKKDALERSYRESRGRIKGFEKHREEPFSPEFAGKWMDRPAREIIRSHPGVPQGREKRVAIASIECIEPISCDLCAQACPEEAISRLPKGLTLKEEKCTACGICLDACPSAVPVLIAEPADRTYARLTLPERSHVEWKTGEVATLVNRRGESLGSARVAKFAEKRLELEIAPHLLWEARGARKKIAEGIEAPFRYADASPGGMEGWVEIFLEGEKRLARDGSTLAEHFFETGRARPGETLACPDGSCGLCVSIVDGVRKLACQERIHKGMTVVRVRARFEEGVCPPTDALCPCLGIPESEVVERVEKGKLSSPEAARAITRVGEGRCHGLLCTEAFRRLLVSRGVDAENWQDWRFPWTEWNLPGQKPT